MKLDRNVNRGGHGKYALVNMRKLVPIIEAIEGRPEAGAGFQAPLPTIPEMEDLRAFTRLVERGVISLGNETPGDQFFVLKYKDQFTAPALQAYVDAIRAMLRYSPQNEEQRRIGSEMGEYAIQM